MTRCLFPRLNRMNRIAGDFLQVHRDSMICFMFFPCPSPKASIQTLSLSHLGHRGTCRSSRRSFTVTHHSPKATKAVDSPIPGSGQWKRLSSPCPQVSGGCGCGDAAEGMSSSQPFLVTWQALETCIMLLSESCRCLLVSSSCFHAALTECGRGIPVLPA